MAGAEAQPDWCAALYDAEAANLLLYGRALGLSHAEAEDVLQEIFAALLARPTPPATPVNYAVRAFRNRALSHRRSLWRRLTREFEARHWFEPGSVETPGERAAVRCLARLPAEQREVLVLKFWQGLTFEEIGEVQAVSAHTAAGRYRYGLAKLRACLEKITHESVDPAAFPFLEAAAAESDAPRPAVR
jgi:RNA polymerase sigma-70 factor, ECF subfamily